MTTRFLMSLALVTMAITAGNGLAQQTARSTDDAVPKQRPDAVATTAASAAEAAHPAAMVAETPVEPME